jgi:hypothetical protein
MHRKLGNFFPLNTMTSYSSSSWKNHDNYHQNVLAEMTKSISNLTFNLYLDAYMDCQKQNSRHKKDGKTITSNKDLYVPHPPNCLLNPFCQKEGKLTKTMH